MELMDTNRKAGNKKKKKTKKPDIFALISAATSQEDLNLWEGTIETYLPLVIKDPKYNDTAHARIWRMIESAGIEFAEDDKDQKHPLYTFFRKDLFGIDETLHRLMVDYFKAAAVGSDVSKRILLLYGPTSSGKSDFTAHIKAGLEQFSRTTEGKLFAIKGCPMHENPLNAIPKAARADLKREFGLVVDGGLCPLCSLRLKEDFGGEWKKLPVERIFLSEDDRIGIGTFQPADPKSQDQAELTGSINLSKITEYGSESDARAFDFNGELNVANRGAMEFIELLKVDPKFRHILLTLAEEKKIKAPRFPLISADLAILAHTNETEYKKFLAQKEEEAIQSRMIVRRFPYNLVVDSEVKIYEKLLLGVPAFNDIHIAPHTLKVAAMFSILTRLEKPKDEKITLLKKMRAYNHEDVEGLGKDDVKNLQENTDREGMEGVDPRYIVNRLSSCFVKHDVSYITPISALRSIEEGLDTNAQVSDDDRERFQGFISDVIEEYSKIACNEVQKAFFLNFEGEIKALLNNYIDNALAYLNEEKVLNEWEEHEEPDERLMRRVEEKIGITDGGKRTFREEVTRKMLQLKDRDGDYDYKSHARLNEALKKQLFEERSDIIRITVSVRNPDPEALKRLNEVIATLSDHYGYTPESANELLRYVSSVMAKNE